MQFQGSHFGIATRSLLVRPRRLLGALTCTAAVVASAITVQALAPRGDAPMLAAIYGGLAAFNLLLFFPPGMLIARPPRIIAALLVMVVPLPLSPLLYHVSPILADAALAVAAGVSVLARPLGAPASGFALLVALNLLTPLVLGGAPSLVPLGALAAVSGTIFAIVADAASAALRRAPAPAFEQRLLRVELAGFLADLSQLWHSGQIWPQPRLSARIARVRSLRDEIGSVVAPVGAAGLPPDAILEDIARCAAALRTRANVSAATDAAVATSLATLAEAARADRADSAHQAVEAMRRAALHRPGPGEPEPPARMLGLALVLSDLIEAALPRRSGEPGPT